MSDGRSIQAHEIVVSSNPDFITSTKIGNKNAIDVNLLSAGGTDADQIQGNVANSGVDIGNPVKIGYLAKNTVPTAVSDGDRVDATGTLFGEVFIAGMPQYSTLANISNAGNGTSSHTIQMDAASRLDFLVRISANPSSATVAFTIEAELLTGTFIDVTNDIYGVTSFSTAVLGFTFGQYGIDNGGYTKAFKSIKFVVNISGASADVNYVIATKKTTL